MKFTDTDSCLRTGNLLGTPFRVEIHRRVASCVGPQPLWVHMSNSTPLGGVLGICCTWISSEGRHWTSAGTSVNRALKASGSVILLQLVLWRCLLAPSHQLCFKNILLCTSLQIWHAGFCIDFGVLPVQTCFIWDQFLIL